MAFSDLTNLADRAFLEAFGEPIQYRNVKGMAPELVGAMAILDESSRGQSTTPGYFGEIEVDPAVIADPQVGDVVVWKDGVEYVVARVRRLAYGLTRLTIHRKDDPEGSEE